MTNVDKPRTDRLLPRGLIPKLRNAILKHEASMTEIRPGVRELTVGMFVIHHALHVSGSGRRSSSITISMGSPDSSGGYPGSTLASLRSGGVALFTYGAWVDELLRLLTKSGRELTDDR